MSCADQFIGRSLLRVPQTFSSTTRDHRQIVLVFAYLVLTLIMVAYASMAQAQTPAQAIGQVETLRGNATTTRNDNTVLTLRVGDPIFLGDTVRTAAESTLGITFLDQTVFSLSANAQMVINDLVYNPQGASNNMAINLVKGTFVFLAGRIAPTGNMRIETPVAQIGIRGTLPWITVGDTTSFAILTERDGKTGEYVLFRKGTQNVIGTVNLATVGTTRKLVMNSPTDDPRTVDKTPEELAAEQRFRNQIFDTLTKRDTRLGITPDQGTPPNGPGSTPGGGNPPPGDQGSIPGSAPSNAALLQQAAAIVATCTAAQSKINRATQLYHRGDYRQSRQLLQDADGDIGQLPLQSCDSLLQRIAAGQQAINLAEENERSTRAAIASCNENEIDRLRNTYASSRQSSARTILARLDRAAEKCANRRIQRARVEEKSQANAECRRLNGSGYYAGKIRGDGSFSCRPTKRTANAWCRNKNGRGSIAARIRADGSFSCRYSRQERTRQAWAQCRRQYGNALATVKIYNSGRYRCIVRQEPPPRRTEQSHDPATSAAVIGGILGAIEGLSNRRRNRNDDPPTHRRGCCPNQ